MTDIAKISICAKCSDLFWMRAVDEHGALLIEHEGYVPGFMPGEHYGDYVELDIDPKTGQILNWREGLTTKSILKSVKEA